MPLPLIKILAIGMLQMLQIWNICLLMPLPLTKILAIGMLQMLQK